MILGVHMTLLLGPTIAVPAPLAITEALTSVEVTQSDADRSGFQLTFQVGRAGPADLLDHGLLLHPLLRPFTRVIVMVHFNLLPTVLIDGFVTQTQLLPTEEPGGSTLVVTGRDVTVMMDMDEIALQLPMPEVLQIGLILAKYAVLGWTGAMIIPPVVPEPFLLTKEIPTQNGTDYNHLQALAARHDHVFFVRPGPVPNTNIPYWGPRVPPDAVAMSVLAPALSVNMGPRTNVSPIRFSYDALATVTILGEAVEPNTNLPLPVVMPPVSTTLPLALIPAAVNQLGRTRTLRPNAATPVGRKGMVDEAREAARTAQGLSVPQVFERARAEVDESTHETVGASGELDALQYGAALQARTVVGLRGAGFTHDGLYFVKSVTHSITKNAYKQRFTLSREGVGSIVPLVHP